MEKEIQFVPVMGDNTGKNKVFEEMMYDYIDEMNEHSHRPLPKQYQLKWIQSILSKQGPKDRHLELCCLEGQPVGFLYGKVDHPDHKGYIKPGYGYIMEFYVKPEFRRSGMGTRMLSRMENLFRNDGVKRMYLTSDPVTGKPFWEAKGFVNTWERSPDNDLYLYEKPL